MVTTTAITANENERALLWRDSLWKKRSEPGRNQEESGEKLLRKLMQSQVFLEHHSGFSPENRAFNRAFAGVSPEFPRDSSRVSPRKSRFPGYFRGAFLTPRGGFHRAFKTAVANFTPADRKQGVATRGMGLNY